MGIADIRFEEQFVTIEGGQLQVGRWRPGNHTNTHPTIVILHDGLGAYSLWGDIPARVAARLQRDVVAVNRAGHGASTPIPTAAWPTDWLHREADLLVALLESGRLPVGQQIQLVGHSDGGSIALLAALAAPDHIERVTVLAAHTWVEPVCTAAIAAVHAEPAQLLAGLARAHAEPAALFAAWSQVWLSAAFAQWDIRPQLSSLDMPVTVVQGDTDEYATKEMLWLSTTAIGDNATGVLMPGWPHLMNRSHPKGLVDLLVKHHRD